MRRLLLLCLLLQGLLSLTGCQWIFAPRAETRYTWVSYPRGGGYWKADPRGQYYWGGKDFKHIYPDLR